MNSFLAHRLIALNTVLHPDTDPDYELRRIFRWFSKTFNTPLAQVYGLPLDEVLQHYYEARYEELEDAEPEDNDQDQRPYLIRERDILCETAEERQIRLVVEAEDKRIGDKFLRMVEAEEAVKDKKNKEKPKAKEDFFKDSIRQETKMKKLGKQIDQTTEAFNKAYLEAPDELEEGLGAGNSDIEMKF